MTPVEERIDHEEAKRITKDLDAISSELFREGRKDASDVIQDAMNVISALLDDRDALLTGHSAREEVVTLWLRWRETSPEAHSDTSRMVTWEALAAALDKLTTKETPCQ